VYESRVPPTVPCPTCSGAGTIPMPEQLVRALKSICSGRETIDKIHADGNNDISLNGINNRVTELMKLGLVKRWREGRFFHYKPTPKGNKYARQQKGRRS
jgi:predicted transcriptional regulator